MRYVNFNSFPHYLEKNFHLFIIAIITNLIRYYYCILLVFYLFNFLQYLIKAFIIIINYYDYYYLYYFSLYNCYSDSYFNLFLLIFAKFFRK